MKILMIRPKAAKETIGLQHIMIVEPLELEVLAATINEEITIIDMILEKESIGYFVQKYSPDVFCVTGYISHVNIMISYCKQAKEISPNIITIAGGVHLEKNPNDFDSKWIDYRVVRNATTSFPELIEYLKNNTKFPEGVYKKGEKEKNLPEFNFYYPIPNRELTRKYQKHYFYLVQDKVALIKTSFGCPFSCNFCFCRQITAEKYFERNLDDVIQELQSIWQEEIYIVDDDFLVSAKRLRNFIDAVKKHNIKKKYLVYGRADFISDNKSLIQDFKNIGLRAIIVGIESFNEQELNEYNKNLDQKKIIDAIRFLHQLKVDIYGTLIIPSNWGKKDFSNLEKTLRKLNLRYLNLQPLTPLPGIDFQIQENRIIVDRKEFEKWDLAHVVIQPEKLSVKQYYKNIRRIYFRTYFRPKFLFSHMKYSLKSRYRMSIGAFKIFQQYKRSVKNA